MRSSFVVAAWVVLALASIRPACGDTNPAEERAFALGILRLVQAAEADYFHSQGRYATFQELIHSHQLAQTAAAQPENLGAYFKLNLESESEPAPGFRLDLQVPAGGVTYRFRVSGMGNCAYGVLTDEKGAIYEKKMDDCSDEDSADASAAPGVPAVDWALPRARVDVPCPLPELLTATSKRARELEDNLQKFTARELIEHREMGKNGKWHNSTSSLFNYVAEIHESTEGGAYIDEYRAETGPIPPSHPPLADSGTAAFALLFLPHNMEEFSFSCDGLTELNSRPVWQLHFAQRTDRANDFRAYRINNRLYPANIMGRAWVAADSFEVLRLESDLLEPIKEINLQTEHLMIDYGPVAFPKHDVRLWLPDTVSLHIEYRGHRYERTHRFSGFQLFWVDTVQETKGPPSEEDGRTKKN
jgi:hypothetical protein